MSRTRRRSRTHAAFALAIAALAPSATPAQPAAATAGPTPRTLSELSWSEDGRQLVGLADDGTRTSAFQAYDGATGRRTWRIPLDTLRDPATGRPPRIDRWQPSVAEGVLLIESKGDLFLAKPGADVRRLTSTKSAETDATFSPDGRTVAFVRDGDLWTFDVERGREQRLTDDGRPPAVINGGSFESSPFANRRGFAWAPESRTLTFVRRAGGSSSLRLTSTLLPSVLELETGPPAEGTIVGALWRFDARALVVERRRAADGRLELLLCHPEMLHCRPLANRAATGAALGPPVMLTNGFVWASSNPRAGLAFYDTIGRERALIRSGDWEVTRLEGLDELGNAVLARAERTPRGGAPETALLRLDIASRAAPLVLAAGGDLELSVSPTATTFVATWTETDGRRRRELRSSDGKLLGPLPPP